LKYLSEIGYFYNNNFFYEASNFFNSLNDIYFLHKYRLYGNDQTYKYGANAKVKGGFAFPVLFCPLFKIFASFLTLDVVKY
jgi:hypothetical protein